ncbi:MAG: hypothetical protein WCP79_11975 [Bacillota bacterium]
MRVYCFYCQPAVIEKYQSLLKEHDFEFAATVHDANLYGYVSDTEFTQRIFLVDCRATDYSELLRVANAQRAKFDPLYTIALVANAELTEATDKIAAQADEMIFDECSVAETVMRFVKARHSLTECSALQRKLAFDPVTGALNEQSMRAMFLEQYDLAKREGKPFTLVAMDVQINTYGTGDSSSADMNKLAQDVVSIMRGKLRKYDIISRFENNTYVAMLPNSGARSASIISSRLKKELKYSLRCSSNMAIAVWTPGQLMMPDLIIGETLNQLEVAKVKGHDNIEYVDWWI